MIKALRATTATTALALGMIAAPAAAQTPPASDVVLFPVKTLPEIVVTAQRRPAPIDTVPVTVSAFPAELIETRRIARLLDVAQGVPNTIASHEPGLGSANTYTIRGLGSPQAFATVDPAVSTFVDGVPLNGQYANDLGLFDVAQVDVLRGPQTTLFGRNTNGGAVDVRLRAPGERIAGYFEGGYGSYEAKDFRGSIDIPINPSVAVKLSGYLLDGTGYVNNSTTGLRGNDGDRAGLRGAIRLDPTERLSWNASVAYLRDDGENAVDFDCDPRNPANCSGRFATSGLGLTYDAAHPSPLATAGVTGRKANFGAQNRTDTVLGTSTLAWRGDAVTVEAITGLVNTRQKYALDLSDGRGFPSPASPTPPVTGFGAGGTVLLNDAKHDQWSQEVRIGGTLFGDVVDYVVGGQHVHLDDTTDFADVRTTLQSGVAVSQVLADRTARTKTEATSGYASIGAKLAEGLRVSGGVRYTDETRALALADNRAACAAGVPGCIGPLTVPTRQKTRQWSPRADVTYQLPGAMLFASASKGYRSGGWSLRSVTAAGIAPFAPEDTWSYEAGVKSELFDKRLRATLTGFYADTDNFQVTSSGATGIVTKNAAAYRNYGVEAELAAVPVTGLTLFANIGYQKDKYRVAGSLALQQANCRAELAAQQVPLVNAIDCARGIVDANGAIATPVRTPDVTIAGGGSYDYAIPAAGIILQPSVNAVYRSAYETDPANATIFTGSVGPYPANPFGGDIITGSRVKAHVQVNAALSMKTDDGNWIVSAECSNCLDKSYGESSLFGETYLNPPRQWLVRAKRTF